MSKHFIIPCLSLLFAAIYFMNYHTALASKQKQGSDDSIVVLLALKHSRTTLLIPKTLSKSKEVHRSSTAFSRKQSESSEPLGMITEPLRAVRDGFLVPLYLGTPPQVVQVYMDTGSDLTWVPCSNDMPFDCLNCDDFGASKLTVAFSPSRSSTSLRDLCSSSFCIDIHSSDNYIDACAMSGCSLRTLVESSCTRPCPTFAYTYGAGGVVIGLLARDTLRVHENILNPNLTREIQSFAFGCIGSSYREPMGIVGFGRGPLSLPSQLGFLQKGFSHCFLPFKFANNPNMSSPLVIGDVSVSSDDDESLQFTPMLKSHVYPNYYYIGLEAITVGDSSASTKVPMRLREFDSQGNGGMLIDSGTTYTHLPEPIYSQLLSSLRLAIPYPRANDIESKTGFDLCYRIPYTSGTIFVAEEPDLLPSITFHFLNNASLVLSMGSHFYAMGAPKNSTVAKCLLFQSMEDGEYGPAGVLGSFQQQNVRVVYDLENERIGFQQMDCTSSAITHGLRKKP